MSRAHVDEGEGVTRVLVVEPSRIVRRGIREELAADHSLAVAEAASGAEALAAVSEHPDVVLVDLDLPDRPGHEVCCAILELLPSTAVVVLAAEGGEASVRAAIDAGARGYLLKDAGDLDLPDAIRRVLAGRP
jgi:DNA-binding NarL/FixJ family response regulator